MSDTECSKCHQPLQLGDGLEWGMKEDEVLCWGCQQDEIHRLRSQISSGEQSFGEWWATQIATLPLSRPKLARAAFLAGLARGRRSPEAAEE
jgi:hypothetical protein